MSRNISNTCQNSKIFISPIIAFISAVIDLMDSAKTRALIKRNRVQLSNDRAMFCATQPGEVKARARTPEERFIVSANNQRKTGYRPTDLADLFHAFFPCRACCSLFFRVPKSTRSDCEWRQAERHCDPCSSERAFRISDRSQAPFQAAFQSADVRPLEGPSALSHRGRRNC